MQSTRQQVGSSSSSMQTSQLASASHSSEHTQQASPTAQKSPESSSVPSSPITPLLREFANTWPDTIPEGSGTIRASLNQSPPRSRSENGETRQNQHSTADSNVAATKLLSGGYGRALNTGRIVRVLRIPLTTSQPKSEPSRPTTHALPLVHELPGPVSPTEASPMEDDQTLPESKRHRLSLRDHQENT